MEKVSSACLLDESNLLIASSHFLYLVEQNERELISAQFFEQIITHIHSFKKSYVVCTDMKFLIIFNEGNNIKEKTKLSEPGDIQDIKMLEDCIIVAVGNSILFFKKHGNEYFQKEAKKIKLENSFPINIGIISDTKKFLVITQDQNMYKINSEMKEKGSLSTAKELYCSEI